MYTKFHSAGTGTAYRWDSTGYPLLPDGRRERKAFSVPVIRS